MKTLSPFRPALLLSILALLFGWQLSVPGQDPAAVKASAPVSIPPQLPPWEPPFYTGSPPGYSGPSNPLPVNPMDLRRMGLAAPALVQTGHPLNPDWDPSWERDPSSIPNEVLMTEPDQLNPRELRLLDRGLERETASLTEQYTNATDEDDRKELESRLTAVVNQHFAVRHSIRDREIAELEKEVASLRKRLQQREDAKQQITKGRVDQLTRSATGMGWDGSKSGIQQFRYSADPHPAAGLRPQTGLAQGDEKKVAPVVEERNAEEEEAARMKSWENAIMLGRAMHVFHDEHGSLPPAVAISPNGLKHSWRVRLLPYLGYSDLYSKYRFDQPWDSPENKKLLSMTPDVYLAPGAAADSSHTFWFAITGEGTAFESNEGIHFRGFTDGLSRTLLLAESKLGVAWTQPEDIEYSAGKLLPKLGGIHEDGFMSVLADGSVRLISNKIKEDELRNLILRNDRNVIDPEDLHPEKYSNEQE